VNQEKKLSAGLKSLSGGGAELGALPEKNPVDLTGQELAMIVIRKPEIEGVTTAVLLQEAELGFFHVTRNGEVQIESVSGNKFLNRCLAVNSRVGTKILSDLMKDVLYTDHNAGFKICIGKFPL